LNNFLLPVRVSEQFLQKIFSLVQQDPSTEVEVDLEKQTIKILATGDKEHFDINPYKKECLINGYDDIDYLLSIMNEIEQFEATSEKTLIP